MVDEVEARWQRCIHQTYPDLKYVEVYWESAAEQSQYTFQDAVRKIAILLNIHPLPTVFGNVSKHEHVTAEYRAQMMKHRQVLRVEEAAYMKIMGKYGYFPEFSHLPSTYNNFDLPTVPLTNNSSNDTGIIT
jgi:hypothetical protein